MTTLIPRDPYTQDELARLYPAALKLQLVQVVSVLVPTSRRNIANHYSSFVMVRDSFIMLPLRVFLIVPRRTHTRLLAIHKCMPQLTTPIPLNPLSDGFR